MSINAMTILNILFKCYSDPVYLFRHWWYWLTEAWYSSILIFWYSLMTDIRWMTDCSVYSIDEVLACLLWWPVDMTVTVVGLLSGIIPLLLKWEMT
jgi:hypothetical protein